MNLICPNCKSTLSVTASREGEGLSIACRNCGAGGKVTGLIIMAFADDSDPSKDRERFVEDIEKSVVRTWYAYNTVEEFMAHWHKMVEEPDGMWYWVLYKGECICSGACDPYDEDIFKEEFCLDENENPSTGSHWKETKWCNWKKCSCCGAVVQQAEDYERSGLYQFCPRCGKAMAVERKPDKSRGGSDAG